MFLFYLFLRKRRCNLVLAALTVSADLTYFFTIDTIPWKKSHRMQTTSSAKAQISSKIYCAHLTKWSCLSCGSAYCRKRQRESSMPLYPAHSHRGVYSSQEFFVRHFLDLSHSSPSPRSDARKPSTIPLERLTRSLTTWPKVKLLFMG